MKKKYVALIGVAVLVLLVILIGVTERMRTKTPPVSSESEIFEIGATNPVIVKEDDDYRLQYKLVIDNKSDQAINSLSISAEINPALDAYLLSGNTMIPLGEYELATKETAELANDKAYGAECTFELLLRTEDDLATEGITYQDVLRLGHKITVHLEWAGGYESYVCAANTTAEQPTDAELTASYAAEALNTWAGSQSAFWGGAYRDGEQCVVLLAEDNEGIRKEVIERFTFKDILVFKKCTFSLSYLQSIYDKIIETESDAYLSHNISVRDNCVIVRLVKTDEAVTAALERLDTAGNGQALRFHIVNLDLY